MKLSELLEEDKESLLRSLSGVSAQEGTELLQRETDRLLAAWNSGTDDPAQQETAAAMFGAFRAALPLTDTAGETRVWEERKSGKRAAGTMTTALAVAGCVLCLAAAAFMLYRDMAPLLALLPVVGGALLTWAGFRGARAGGGALKAEPTTDWAKAYRTLHTAALVMDQTLHETASRTQWERRKQDEETSPLPEDTMELAGDLLEALYSGDGGFALDRLASVRTWLHGMDIEAVDYDPAQSALFDCMPGMENATVCPALTRGGKLLRRGIATVRTR